MYGIEESRQFPPIFHGGVWNHIFTVVARADVEPELDWRLPVFEAGRYLVALDGAALLLLERWR